MPRSRGGSERHSGRGAGGEGPAHGPGPGAAGAGSNSRKPTERLPDFRDTTPTLPLPTSLSCYFCRPGCREAPGAQAPRFEMSFPYEAVSASQVLLRSGQRYWEAGSVMLRAGVLNLCRSVAKQLSQEQVTPCPGSERAAVVTPFLDNVVELWV